MLAVLLHVVGLFVVGSQLSQALELAAAAPELEVTSVLVSIEEPTIDSPSSPNSDVQPSMPNPEPLPLPQSVEPAPAEALPDKPDFTEALTPPPLPVFQTEPSPVVIPLPAPSPAPASPAPAPVQPATGVAQAATGVAQAATSPGPSGPPATLQTVGAGGGASERVDAQPSLKRAIKPNYPIGSRRRNEEGTVILDVTVAADGRASKVVSVSSSGFADLDHAAELAVAKAHFKPGMRDGKPVESAARLTLIFRLRDS